MFAQHFANFLLDKDAFLKQTRLISEQQKKEELSLACRGVEHARKEQAEKLNALQRQTDRRFGDLALNRDTCP